jgi:hypothetical protein
MISPSVSDKMSGICIGKPACHFYIGAVSTFGKTSCQKNGITQGKIVRPVKSSLKHFSVYGNKIRLFFQFEMRFYEYDIFGIKFNIRFARKNYLPED